MRPMRKTAIGMTNHSTSELKMTKNVKPPLNGERAAERADDGRGRNDNKARVESILPVNGFCGRELAAIFWARLQNVQSRKLCEISVVSRGGDLKDRHHEIHEKHRHA